MKARHDGRCAWCGGRIRVGDEIVRARVGWQHDTGDGDGCPADPVEPGLFDPPETVMERIMFDDYMKDCGDR